MHLFPLMKTFWKIFPSNIFSVENCDSLNPNILSLSVTPNSYTQIGLRFEKILALHFTKYTSTYFLYFFCNISKISDHCDYSNGKGLRIFSRESLLLSQFFVIKILGGKLFHEMALKSVFLNEKYLPRKP